MPKIDEETVLRNTVQALSQQLAHLIAENAYLSGLVSVMRQQLNEMEGETKGDDDA